MAEKKIRPDLLKQLHHGGPKLRAAAIRQIGEYVFRCPDAITYIIGGLGDPHPLVRSAAADVLREIEPPVMEAVPALVRALKDPDSDVRDHALTAILWMHPPSPLAVEALIEIMNEDVENCHVAVDALGAIGPLARPAVPQLIQAMKDGQYPAVAKHGARERPGAEIGSSVAEPLKRDDLWVHECIARAMGRIGPAARAAVPALLELLHNQELFDAAQATYDAGVNAGQPMWPPAFLRVAVALSLWRIDQHEVAIPTLIAAVHDPLPSIRTRANTALFDIGMLALPALPDLVQALRDPVSHHVRESAANALGALGPGAIPAIPALAEALNDDDDGVRIWTAKALTELGPLARPAVPNLIDLSKRASGRECVWVAEALWVIARHEAAIEALTRIVESSDIDGRWPAAETLGYIGKAAALAIPSLMVVALDPRENPDLRGAAAEAVRSIVGRGPRTNR